MTAHVEARTVAAGLFAVAAAAYRILAHWFHLLMYSYLAIFTFAIVNWPSDGTFAQLVLFLHGPGTTLAVFLTVVTGMVHGLINPRFYSVEADAAPQENAAQ